MRWTGAGPGGDEDEPSAEDCAARVSQVRQDLHLGLPAPHVGRVVVGAGHGHDHRARHIGGRRGLHYGHGATADVVGHGRLLVHHHDVAHVVFAATTIVRDVATDPVVVMVVQVVVVVVVVVVGRRRRHLVAVDRGQYVAAHGLRHGAQLRRVPAVVAAHRRRAHHHRGRRVHQVAARPQRAGPRPVTGRAAVVGRLVVVDQRGRLVQVQLTRVAAATHVLTPASKNGRLEKCKKKRKKLCAGGVDTPVLPVRLGEFPQFDKNFKNHFCQYRKIIFPPIYHCSIPRPT